MLHIIILPVSCPPPQRIVLAKKHCTAKCNVKQMVTRLQILPRHESIICKLVVIHFKFLLAVRCCCGKNLQRYVSWLVILLFVTCNLSYIPRSSTLKLGAKMRRCRTIKILCVKQFKDWNFRIYVKPFSTSFV